MTNAEQIASWAGQVGDNWVANQAHLDTQLEPLGRAVQRVLAPQPGERIADIGCGTGQTTAQLAEAGASVIGVDVSTPMLALARQRFPALEFVLADASTYEFATKLDAIYSRFGVMFFSDPTAAFTHLHRSMREGGRLAFLCWRAPSESPAIMAPLDAAIAAGLPPPAPLDPLAPGPFAFADPDRVRSILSQSGFTSIELAKHDEDIGGNSLESTVAYSLAIGPLARALRETPGHVELATNALRELFSKHLVDGKVYLRSATWIVTATA